MKAPDDFQRDTKEDNFISREGEFPIRFRSLDRIEGREGRSKLLDPESDLYKVIQGIKAEILRRFKANKDRMDLHIEITRKRRPGPVFREKAEVLHGQAVDLRPASSWGYIGAAFVLWTPEVPDYGRTHITVAFFGRHSRPDERSLHEIVHSVIAFHTKEGMAVLSQQAKAADEDNNKNRLFDLVQNLGCGESCIDFQTEPLASNHGFQRATAVVQLPDGRRVVGSGEGRKRKDAEMSAAGAVLDSVRRDHADLIVDWDEIFSEAQAGDALIKLGAYLDPNLDNPEKKSRFLQKFETDANLAKVYERWRADGDPDLQVWGDNLGAKKKATLIEALVWRRNRSFVMSAPAPAHLRKVLNDLQRNPRPEKYQLILDGQNLKHSLDYNKKRFASVTQADRAFSRALCDYVRQQDRYGRVMVVLDGSNRSGFLPIIEAADNDETPTEVILTQKESADDVIVSVAGKIPKDVCYDVVTNDKGLRGRLKRFQERKRSIRILTVPEFIEAVGSGTLAAASSGGGDLSPKTP